MLQQEALSLYRAFNINSDVDRLYVQRSLGSRGLLSIVDTVQTERNSLGYYLTQSSEPILHLISEHGWFSSEEPKVCKSLIQNGHMSSWMGKALHGHFFRDVLPLVDLKWRRCCIKHTGFTKETEGFIFAA